MGSLTSWRLIHVMSTQTRRSICYVPNKKKIHHFIKILDDVNFRAYTYWYIATKHVSVDVYPSSSSSNEIAKFRIITKFNQNTLCNREISLCSTQ